MSDRQLDALQFAMEDLGISDAEFSDFLDGGIPGVAKTAEDYHAFLDRLVIELKMLGYTPKIKWIVGRKPGAENTSQC